MITDITQLKKQRALVELLNVLMAKQHRYMSTIDLQENGIFCPAAGIARLKNHGVVFETIYQTIADRSGRDHKHIACYKIIGGVVL